ncbi:MAG: hypothetical protein ACRDQA_02490 [Nocardioidaceae bacterium]
MTTTDNYLTESERKADDRRFRRRLAMAFVPIAVATVVVFTLLRMFVTGDLDARTGAVTDIVTIAVLGAAAGRVMFWWSTRPERRR